MGEYRLVEVFYSEKEQHSFWLVEKFAIQKLHDEIVLHAYPVNASEEVILYFLSNVGVTLNSNIYASLPSANASVVCLFVGLFFGGVCARMRTRAGVC